MIGKKIRLTKRESGEFTIEGFIKNQWEVLSWFDSLEVATKEFDAALNRHKRHIVSEVIAEGEI